MIVVRTSLTIVGMVIMTMVMSGQSQTTGTLHLRNAQPATVSLSVPSAGVTSYSILLPDTIGTPGQILSVGNVGGTTASLAWSDGMFWEHTGSTVTAGGTGAGQQYLGTSNTQDLVLASAGVERLRIVGTAGPGQGFVGVGTLTPGARLDVTGAIRISSDGAAGELRIAEPSTAGNDVTILRAAAQASDITYTLPSVPPSADGMILTSTAGGVMAWEPSLSEMARGIFVPTAGQYQHTIPITGLDLLAGSIPVLTMINAAGTTIAVSVTGIDAGTNTLYAETSAPLAAGDRIAWIVVNP
ncbi:MAG: hypothetical protein J0I17_08290 ['Candidatus Kapabacteria' thiocyanatum]|uniref:Uncharacterized protein n=1 Tax=Candidatus Kapaibacterium thiocyanatum TaxID=1895771 RepID=A0A1M3L1Y3_9BACT|nr:hypothetical protein ['Candidatus Kapabacteria' thiocyanatum]OJX59232.1 MAG: hypothetical protein BGO89_02090 ['Candidatus Kapabacteria' thiocyanatum]